MSTTIPSKFLMPSAARLLGTVCAAAMMVSWASLASAQVTISDDRTAPIDTETEDDDIIIDSDGSITLTTVGPAVTVNSDNTVTHQGTITISDVDDATGVLLEGGANRGFTMNSDDGISTSTIVIDEDYTATDTDSDGIIDGPRAIGSGRTGILISGASPFEGNIELDNRSSIFVEGNESYGINLANTSMMTTGLSGDLTNGGTITLIGDNGAAVNIAGNMNGDLVNTGSVSVSGENSNGYNVSGDIQGGFVNSGSIGANAFRFNSRIPFGGDNVLGREEFEAEDLQNAGSSVAISGNISQGIHFDLVQEEILDDDGVGTGLFSTVRTSTLTQLGSAPAVLIDGNGTPIAIGRVGQITDPTDDDFNEDLLFGFVNEGTINAQGLYDDFDATVISISDATIENGVFNSGTLSVSTFRGPGTRTVEGVTPGTGHSRVIVLGQGAIVDAINNTGTVAASASEAVQEVYADSDNPLAAVNILATAIDIGENATADTLYNRGVIAATIIGRNGEAFAIKDASGTLNSLTNEGFITATGTNSDPLANEEVNFTLVAIDVSSNTTGFTYTQQLREDTDPDDGIDPASPFLIGDIRLGSGDDTISATAGSIIGNIDFGTGQDELLLSGSSGFAGEISNADDLSIIVTDNSNLSLIGTAPVPIANASFDETSTFLPTLDGQGNSATTLTASSTVSFAEGSAISPRFSSIVSDPEGLTFTLASANTLDVSAAALAQFGATDTDQLPFLYNFDYALNQIDGQDALVVTVDLRDPTTPSAQGGLGLDAAQAQAFAPALGAFVANSDLGSAIANITNEAEFNRAFNQLLPEFASAAREFVIANVDGATGAVGSHLDTTRRSPDKPGGAWIQEFAYFADRERAGLSEQYRGSGFGITGGLDTAWGPFHAIGVNAGFASTEIEDVAGQDEPLDVITLQGGVYAGLSQDFGQGQLGTDLYIGVGLNKFEQERRITFDDFFGQASADYKGTHINASARTGYEVALTEKFWIRPTLSVDYLRLSQDGYTESGDEGIALDVSSRTTDTASAAAMFNFGAKFQGKRTWIRPALRVGYRHSFLNDPTQTEFGFAGLDGQRATIESFAFPDSGVLLGFTIAAGSAYSSIGFDFDSDIRDGFMRHTGRVVIRLLF